MCGFRSPVIRRDSSARAVNPPPWCLGGHGGCEPRGYPREGGGRFKQPFIYEDKLNGGMARLLRGSPFAGNRWHGWRIWAQRWSKLGLPHSDSRPFES